MRGRRLRSGTVAVCLLAGFGLEGHAWAVDTANAWERWEKVLTSSQARTPLQAYHDVQVKAKFWVKSGSACVEPAACPPVPSNSQPTTCFQGLAAWDGDAANPGRFLVRSAFPAGSWCWRTCLLAGDGTTCVSDAGLNQSGEVTVRQPAGVARSALYTNGFPRTSSGVRKLTYANGQTPFQWLGDTAWNAPVSYGLSASNQATWSGYVTQRMQGFTNVLVAPAVQTLRDSPAGGFRGFVAPPGCGTGTAPVVPAACHYWDSAYWRGFDAQVKAANDAGIVVIVAGVMDPLNRAGSNQQLSPAVAFPRLADASAFARNFAARLAGSFVIFSPSFDSKTTDATADGLKAKDLINAVGAAIHAAAPRHLIGMHLAGGSPLASYDDFQNSSWLNLQVFQSGHGSAACEAGLTDDYAKYACRARDFALRFRCMGDSSLPACAGLGVPSGNQSKPAVNVEGQYEQLGIPLSRIQSRHIGWNSALSGSFGYNIGLWPDVTAWTNPTAYASADHHADEDLGIMKGLFKSMPWSGLTPRHDLLVEQNNFSQAQCGSKPKADWLQLWKPHLALDVANGYGLAYLPRPTSCNRSNGGGPFSPTTSIAFSRAAMSNAHININCDNTKGQWTSPGEPASNGGFDPESAACSERNGVLTFSISGTSRIACGATCDRVLVLTKNASGSWSSPNVMGSSTMVDLQPDFELSDDGQTATITGQLVANGLPRGTPRPLSGPERRFRKLPAVALDKKGNFLVAWEEEADSGTDDIVAARFNAQLEPLGSPVVLNDTTEGQQAEPWVSGDDSGNVVAVWTSYSEDTAVGGDIYGKELDADGQPLGPEFLVSTDTQGNQSMPQVQMDGDGGFVVAWTEDPPDDTPGVAPQEPQALVGKVTAISGKLGGVYYRVYGSDGRPRGPERRVADGNAGRAHLSRLEVHSHGGFKLRWHELDASGRDLGEREQEHDRDGNPNGGH